MPYTRILFGIIVAMIGTGLQWVMWSWVGPSRFILYYPAIIIASLLCGLSAGLSATFVSAIAAVYFFFPPIFSLSVDKPTEWIPVVIFVTVGITISMINEILKKRTRDLVASEIQKKTAKQFQQIFESSPNAILAIIDTEGKIQLTNTRSEGVFGYHKNELLGQQIEVLVPHRFRTEHPNHRKSYMEDPIPRGMGVGRDLFALRKDGTEVPVEIALTPIDTDEGQMVLATVTDITVRKKLEIDRTKALQAAEEALQVRDEFLSIASHELNTPLATLGMQIQLIARLAEQKNLVEIAKNSMQQLERFSALIKELLDVSRIRAGRLNLNTENVDLSSLLQNIVNGFQMELNNAKCSIDLQIETPIIGSWDKMRIEQVMINILSNAIKYGAGNPIKISATIAGNNAKITVEDHGIGISPSDQEKIFNRFERAESSAKNFSGLGLGLYIVQKIIEAHRGTIQVTSELGKGSLFTVELPLRTNEN